MKERYNTTYHYNDNDFYVVSNVYVSVKVVEARPGTLEVNTITL